jgi:hypothetical protein
MTRPTRPQRLASRRRGLPLVTLPRADKPEYLRPKRGETIRAFVDRAGWERRGLPMIAMEVVEGQSKPIMRADWGRKINSGSQIVFVARPGGGGGGGSQGVAAVVAMIALMVVANIVAPGIGTALAGAIGVGAASTYAAIATAVIVAGGSMLISAFMAPKSGGKGQGKETFTAWLQGNQARPQQTIPVQYGRLKFNPEFSAQPWNDYQGEDQIFYGLYTLGMGEFEVEEIGVADTPIWTAADGLAEGFENFEYEIVEPDEPVTLFPINVVSATEVSGQEFPDPAGNRVPTAPGDFSWVGPFVLNPAGTVGREVAIDLIFQGGCFALSGDGDLKPVQQAVTIQYRYVDDSGVPIGGTGAAWSTLLSRTYTFTSQKIVRRTERATLPTAGRIQVRGAITLRNKREKGTNILSWAAARMFIQGPQTRPKVTQLAVRIFADQNFSGYSRQQLYVIATRKVQIWDGEEWVFGPTRSPAWAAVDVWTNTDYGLGRPIEAADITAFVALDDEATERGITFNHRFSDPMEGYEALDRVLNAAIAKPLLSWDRFSVVRDRPRTIPALMLTDFSIVRGSVSILYPLQDEEFADGVIVEYLEEEIWQPAEVSSSGSVATLTRPGRVQIDGVTRRWQATWIARYLALTNQKRRKIVTLDVEAEGKLINLGDLVAASTELPESWGQTLRVESWTPASGGDPAEITVHTPANWAPSGLHFARIRRRNGRPFGPVKVSEGDTPDVLVVDATDLALVEAQQGVTLAAAMTRAVNDEPVEISFSPGEPREFLGLATSIRPMSENVFRLSMLAYSDEVYEESVVVPPLPEPPTLRTPAVPVPPASITASLQQLANVLTLSAAWAPVAGASGYEASVSYDAAESWTPVYSGSEPAFLSVGVPKTDVIVRVRARRDSENGVILGAWRVSGLIEAPEIDFRPSAIGHTIGYNDLDPSVIERLHVAGITDENGAALDAFADAILSSERTRGVEASVTRETIVREEENLALAAEITEVEAKTDAGTATGRVRFVAASSLELGVAAAFDVQVRAEVASGDYSEAGLRIEVLDDETSRIVMTAEKLFVRDPALEFVPFAIDSGEVVLQGVTRVGETIRSNATDIHGDPLWSISPGGEAVFLNAKIGGELGAVNIGVGENFRLKRGAKILDGQWPPWDITLTPIGPTAANSFFVKSGFIDAFTTLGPYYFTDERILAEPYCYSGTASATASWLMPDGAIRTTANIDTDPTGSSTCIGFVHPLDWNAGFVGLTFPYKMFCPAIGQDKDFVVPAGCTKIKVKAWGAGGGTSSNINASAGAGGYVEGVIAVTPGDKIRVQTGSGGAVAGVLIFTTNTNFQGWSRGYAGAGKSRFGTLTRASGGGRTAVFKVNPDNSLTPLFIAAGGGSSETGGGLPGGPDGTYGSYHSDWAGGGIGAPTTANNQGGGGGGWRGGILGQGGANYIDAAATSTQNLAGSGATPPNTSDADYVEFVARTQASYSPGRAYGLNARSTIIHTAQSATNGRFGNGGLAVIELLDT